MKDCITSGAPQNCSIPWVIGAPPILYYMVGHTRVHAPNRVLISSAVLAHLVVVSTHTDHGS